MLERSQIYSLLKHTPPHSNC